ncbi:hypothetical protein GCM10010428_42080 [Actinosynnema pretiosum subsp. pretiosum]
MPVVAVVAPPTVAESLVDVEVVVGDSSVVGAGAVSVTSPIVGTVVTWVVVGVVGGEVTTG